MNAVVFDLFHTLVDPEQFRPPGFVRSHAVADLLGFPRAEFTHYWALTRHQRNTDSSLSVRTLIREYALSRGLPASEQALQEAEECLGRYQDRAILEPDPGVLDALRNLRGRGMRIAVLSNVDAREIAAWPRSPLRPLVDRTCFSCFTGVEKPDPRAFAMCLEALGVAAADAAFVGDGGDGELVGAKRAGFGCVVFLRRWVAVNGLRSPEELAAFARQADCCVDDFPALVDLLLSSSRG
ncbi:MAG: HAD family hydrolase [Bacillota bacterium]